VVKNIVHLPNFWAQILPFSIHNTNLYPASPYHHPSICPFDANWWLWWGHLAHLVFAGLDLWLGCCKKHHASAQLLSPNPFILAIHITNGLV
jgi:hypothetical protein